MRVAFDEQIFLRQMRGCISRFFVELSNAIRSEPDLGIIPELFPAEVSAEVHEAKRQYVEQADLVVCVSEATRMDLSRFYGELAAPVFADASGVSDRFARPGTLVENLPDQYLLHIGARSGYKNFALLLDAFAESSSWYPDLNLVVIAAVISRVLADSQLAHDLVDRGQQRAADLSWSRTARLTAEAYRRVVAD